MATPWPRRRGGFTVADMNATDLADLDRDALIALVLKQAAMIEALRAEVEALKRSGKRQAAPFPKGMRKKDPGKPGRKPGQGLFKSRGAPEPETLSGPPIDAFPNGCRTVGEYLLDCPAPLGCNLLQMLDLLISG